MARDVQLRRDAEQRIADLEREAELLREEADQLDEEADELRKKLSSMPTQAPDSWVARWARMCIGYSTADAPMPKDGDQ